MPSFDSSPQKERLVVWVTSLRFPTSNHDLVGRQKFSCKPFYRNPSKKSTGLSRLHHPYDSQTWMIARQRNCTRDWSTTNDKNIRISLFEASRSEVSQSFEEKSGRCTWYEFVNRNPTARSHGNSSLQPQIQKVPKNEANNMINIEKLVNLWKSKAQYPFALIALTNSLTVIQQQEGHLTGLDE